MIVTKTIGAIAGIVIGVGAVAKALDRSPPIDILDVQVLTPVVHPGEDLRIRYSIDRKRICNTTSYPVVIDGANVEYKYEPDQRPAFGGVVVEDRVVSRTILGAAVPGNARYRVVLEFRCNWTHNLWPIVVVLPDVPFVIARPTDTAMVSAPE